MRRRRPSVPTGFPSRAEVLERRVLLAAGSLDPAFGTAGLARAGLVMSQHANATDVLALPDGKILVAGRLSPIYDDQVVARFNADGTLDTTFGAGGGMVALGFIGSVDGVPQLALQPDNRILVATNHGPYHVGLARLNPDGSFDPGFGDTGPGGLGPGRASLGGGPSLEVRTIELQPDGKVLVGGRIFANPGYTSFLLTRFTADGRPDATFGGDGLVATEMGADEDIVQGIAVLPDGRILAAGRAWHRESGAPFPQFHASFGVARYNPDGSLDTTFSEDGKIGAGANAVFSDAGDIALVDGGKFVVAGLTTSGLTVGRFNPDGTPDPTFGGGDGVGPTVASSDVTDMALTADGSFIVSGGGPVAKFTPAGELDVSFGDRGGHFFGVPQGGVSYFAAVDVAHDGRVLVAGHHGSGELMLRSYTPAGRVDTAFGGGDGAVTARIPRGSDEQAHDFLLQPDGKAVVVGVVTEAGGFSRQLGGAVARFNADGSPDAGFGASGVATPDYGPHQERWYAADLLPGGKLLLAGTYADGSSDGQRLFARLNPDGAPDATFGNGGFALGAAGIAYEVAALPDGRFLAAGETGVSWDRGAWLERYDAGGARDAAFPTLTAAATVGPVGRLHPLPDGRFYAAVFSVTYTGGDVPPADRAPKLFRFNADGTPDATFGNGGRARAGTASEHTSLYALAVDAAGRIVVAGSTDNDASVYRFLPDGNLDTAFGTNGAVIRREGHPNEQTIDRWSDVALDGAGRIVAGGYEIPYEPDNSDMTLLRLNDDGTIDDWFGEGGVATYDFGPGGGVTTGDRVAGLAILPDGKILAGGSAALPPVLPIHRRSVDFAVIRVEPDGTKADAGGPYEVNEGPTSDLPLSARGTTLPGRSIAQWEWDFDYDGQAFTPDANGQSVSMPASLLPDGPATHRVAVRVTDSAGDSHVDEAVVTVRNVVPTGFIAGNEAGQAGVPYTIHFNTSDPGRDTLTWRVDWGDGVVETIGNNPTSATHTYADGRNLYEIRALPSDEDGTYDLRWLRVIIDGTNDAPVIDTIHQPEATNEGAAVGVYGRFHDPDTADPLTLTIDWGDGSEDTVRPYDPGYPFRDFVEGHVYRDNPAGTPPDQYTITLTVSDGRLSAVAATTVTVRNVAPTARAGFDRTASEGSAVTLNGSATDPGAGDALAYRWTVTSDNGDVIPDFEGAALTFTPADNGVYTARLTVTDDEGASHADEAVVTVIDVAPALTATVPPTAERGLPFTVTFSSTDPGRDPVLGWTVDWGDGVVDTLPAAATSATHVYGSAPASPRVVIRMTNDDGVHHATPTIGGLDPSFGTGGRSTVRGSDVALLPDGRFVTVLGAPSSDFRNWVVSWRNADGTANVTNVTPPHGGYADSAAVLLLPDGKVLVAGASAKTGGGVYPVLARYNPDGTLDMTFGNGGFVITDYGLNTTISRFWEVALTPDGKIVAAGSIALRSNNGTDTDFFAARFNPDGTPDTTFGTGGRTAAVDFGGRPNHATGLALMPDGKVVVGGQTDSIEQFGGPFFSQSRFGLARFNADGTLDTTFGAGGKVVTNLPGGFSWVRKLAAGPGGTVVAAGSVMSADRATSTWTLARYRADGSLDPAFDGDGIVQTRFSATADHATALEVLPDGAVVAAGNADRGRSYAFARYTPTGQPDASFGTGGKLTIPATSPTTNPASVASFAHTPDGRLLAVGFGGAIRLLPGGAPVTVALPRVMGRHVFYNNSAFDGGSAAATVDDDAAIAADKAALLPGQRATFANVTSYSRGISGVMIDVAGALPMTALAGLAAGLGLHVGSVADPASWREAPGTAQVGIRAGAGVNGSHRITLVWPDGAVRNTWLRVTVPALPEFGLAGDVFYFGNLPGETGDSTAGGALTVTAIDMLRTRRAVGAPYDSRYDFNRDGRVSPLDLAIARSAQRRSLGLPNAPAAPALLPPPATQDVGNDGDEEQSLLA